MVYQDLTSGQLEQSSVKGCINVGAALRRFSPDDRDRATSPLRTALEYVRVPPLTIWRVP